MDDHPRLPTFRRKNMFTPDVIWSLATCGMCIILLVVSHNEPWKREE